MGRQKIKRIMKSRLRTLKPVVPKAKYNVPSSMAQIEHVVIVMMENRSLDHMLGYLSLPGSVYPHAARFEGLTGGMGSWPPAYENKHEGMAYFPTPLSFKETISDPGHERENVKAQLNFQNSKFEMNGFVADYMDEADKRTKDPAFVMGYYSKKYLPVFDYFTQHYAICDHWFAPLPGPTHPNRLMALCGYTEIERNISYPKQTIPRQKFLFDWLTEKGIEWRIYQDGVFSFFSLLSWGPHPFKGRSRQMEDLAGDLANYNPKTFPKVLWIEPEYTIGRDNGNDDHPPAPVNYGQEFLGKLYRTLRGCDEFWSKTLLIVAYDEHGGFFDHCPPLSVGTSSPGSLKNPYPRFYTTGVRVPAFLISPYVRSQSLYSERVDHTCILKLLGARFDPENGYSTEVNSRGSGVLKGLEEAIQQTPESPPSLEHIDKALRQVPGFGEQPTAYESSYMAVARNVAREYVYVGPQRAPTGEGLLPPRMLGITRSTDNEGAKQLLRDRAVVIQALMSGGLSPARKIELCKVHRINPRTLDKLISQIMKNAERSFSRVGRSRKVFLSRKETSLTKRLATLTQLETRLKRLAATLSSKELALARKQARMTRKWTLPLDQK